MLGILVLGGSNLLSIAESTCRFQRYFAELGGVVRMNALERLVISLALTQSPEAPRGKT